MSALLPEQRFHVYLCFTRCGDKICSYSYIVGIRFPHLETKKKKKAACSEERRQKPDGASISSAKSQTHKTHQLREKTETGCGSAPKKERRLCCCCCKTVAIPVSQTLMICHAHLPVLAMHTVVRLRRQCFVRDTQNKNL